MSASRKQSHRGQQATRRGGRGPTLPSSDPKVHPEHRTEQALKLEQGLVTTLVRQLLAELAGVPDRDDLAELARQVQQLSHQVQRALVEGAGSSGETGPRRPGPAGAGPNPSPASEDPSSAPPEGKAALPDEGLEGALAAALGTPKLSGTLPDNLSEQGAEDPGLPEEPVERRLELLRRGLNDFAHEIRDRLGRMLNGAQENHDGLRDVLEVLEVRQKRATNLADQGMASLLAAVGALERAQVARFEALNYRIDQQNAALNALVERYKADVAELVARA